MWYGQRGFKGLPIARVCSRLGNFKVMEVYFMNLFKYAATTATTLALGVSIQANAATCWAMRPKLSTQPLLVRPALQRYLPAKLTCLLVTPPGLSVVTQI